MKHVQLQNCIRLQPPPVLIPGVSNFNSGIEVIKGGVMKRILQYLAVAAVLAGPNMGLAQSSQGTLYQHLGGKKAIVALVDDFVGRVAADKRINSYFAATAADPKRLASFKGKLVDQICQASGGPCKYHGKDMKTAHAGMGITDADFNALVEDLVGALDKFMVADADKQALLAVLGPMKSDIVVSR